MQRGTAKKESMLVRISEGGQAAENAGTPSLPYPPCTTPTPQHWTTDTGWSTAMEHAYLVLPFSLVLWFLFSIGGTRPTHGSSQSSSQKSVRDKRDASDAAAAAAAV